jgi:glyoxylase-like metal-dependent hydrolase (beta-lactamase superfamily II)
MKPGMIAMLAGLLAVSAAAAPNKKTPDPSTAAARASEAAPKKLAEGVWAMMTKGGANAGWFTFGDSVVAVDSGRSVADGEAILAEISATTGHKKVAYLILTNDFGPHAGGMSAFARAGATIITHENFVQGMQVVVAESSPGKRASAPVAGIGTRLVLARPERHVVIRHLGPADSAGDLAVLLAEDKIVFAGDLVEVYLLPPLFSKSIDPDGWVAALGTLAALHPVAVVPGYGPIGLEGSISVTREYLSKTIEIARKLVESKTPEDAFERRLNEPDMKITGLPDELKPSHEANVKALVARLKAAPPPPTK